MVSETIVPYSRFIHRDIVQANVASAKEQVLQGLLGAYLLPMIFQHLEPVQHLEPSKKQRKAELRALALTCKGFSGPALDLLWRKLEALDPLLTFVAPPEESVRRGLMPP
jgi:hypothetical protein